MGFIEATYSAVVTFLDGIAETQFAAISAGIAGSAQILASIVAIAVLVNMALQFRPFDMATSIALIWKMILIAVFLQNWTQFNAVTAAFFDLMESVSTALLGAATGTPGLSETGFARALDTLTDQMADKATVAAGSLNIVGSVVNGINLLLIAVFSAISMIALVAARVVLTVLICVGPLALMASLSDKSKSFFEAWASAMVSMLLFPVLISGVFATIMGMARSSVSPDDPATIGDLGPIMATIVSAIILVMATPFILTQITGSFQIGGFAAKLAGGVMSAAAAFSRPLASGRTAANFGGRPGGSTGITSAAGQATAARPESSGPSERAAKAVASLERQRRLSDQKR